MDTCIDNLDGILKSNSKSGCTSFITIDEEHRGNRKVRSFSGTDRLDDEYFRMIFDIHSPKINNDYRIQAGVMRLSPHSEDEDETFDVVKKRKAMDTAPADDAYDTSPSALAAFEDFESSVLPALEQIQAIDDHGRKQEMLELEDSIAKGMVILPTGGVYFAWSDCLNCMKIGATRRETPLPRLRELSRGVTSPFKLTAWIPTPTPFRLESVMHTHFTAKRIRQAGAGTEFFKINEAETKAYIAQNWNAGSTKVPTE